MGMVIDCLDVVTSMDLSFWGVESADPFLPLKNPSWSVLLILLQQLVPK